MTAKPSVELAEIERGTNCLINFIAHVGNLDAKDIRVNLEVFGFLIASD